MINRGSFYKNQDSTRLKLKRDGPSRQVLFEKRLLEWDLVEIGLGVAQKSHGDSTRLGSQWNINIRGNTERSTVLPMEAGTSGYWECLEVLNERDTGMYLDLWNVSGVGKQHWAVSGLMESSKTGNTDIPELIEESGGLLLE